MMWIEGDMYDYQWHRYENVSNNENDYELLLKIMSLLSVATTLTIDGIKYLT